MAKKYNLLNFKLLKLSISTKGFETLYKIENIKIFKYLFVCLLFIFAITFPVVVKKGYTIFNSGAMNFNVYHLIYIYVHSYLSFRSMNFRIIILTENILGLTKCVLE